MSTPPSTLPIYQVDAFTDHLFGGNPAAVVPLESWIDDALMQQIAMENQLSETAFVVREGGHWALRWFTPVAEVDLCGHATLATAHVLSQELNTPEQEWTFRTLSGDLIVTKTEEGYRMIFPADSITPASNDEVASALGAPVVELFHGKHDMLAILENESAVQQLQPDLANVAQIETRGIIASAKADESNLVDFVSRCFFPRYGINEDPVTGSAHTTMVPYWSEKLSASRLKAAQISQRGGLIDCENLTSQVALSGDAITFLRGEITI